MWKCLTCANIDHCALPLVARGILSSVEQLLAFFWCKEVMDKYSKLALTLWKAELFEVDKL